MQIRELKKESVIPPNEFDLIVSHVIKKSREFVMVHTEYKLTNKEEYLIVDLMERRQAGEPLAYLFGFQEFYGLNFHTNHSTLIPRPETELMVEEALRITHNVERGTPLTIIDIGTGSGCIIISIAHELQTKSELDNKKLFALDLEPKAIKLARKNATMNKVKESIEFKAGNLLEPVADYCYTLQDMRYVICANLPYLTPEQVENSPTIQHEPKSALVSGVEGLDHYQELFKQIKRYQIKKYTIMCEIDDTQDESMSALIKKELPGRQFEIKKDLGGYDRLVIISHNT